MQIHDLKIDPQPFADLVSGAKTCEIRNDDRGFEAGDMVRFPGGYTRTISHIQRGYGLPDGLCVLSYAQASAEIERLRAENTRLDKDNCDVRLALKAASEGWDGALDQRDELQQKLADAQALLRAFYPGCGLTKRKTAELRKQAAAFLSATAQPAEVKS